jgi:cell division protein FtsQ
VSDPRNHDPQPDTAALDELRRAFGGDDDAGAADAAVPTPATDPDRTALDAGSPEPLEDRQDLDGPDGDSGDLAALAVAEPEIEAPEPTPQSIAAPNPPRIIRIDDITGAVRPGDPTPGGTAIPAPAPPAGAPAAPATVISIDADDLPDAVYVAGSLEGDSSRSIVFIEDDIAGDALTPESDRDLRRGIEPRMRERRVQVRRAQSRKRLKWVVAAFVLLLVGIGLLALLGSSMFAVREQDVQIVGAVYTDPAELAAIVDDLVGTPTLLVDTQTAEDDLEQIAWVDEAKVTVSFPHSLTIELRERQAMATYQGPDARFRVLDREGRVLDVLDKYPIAYVLITGPDAVDLEEGQFAPKGYVAAAELAKNLTGSVRGQVERIEVTANGSSLTMWLTDGSDVRFGEARDLFTKLVRLETRLALEVDREPGPIDVSTN